MYSLSRDFCWRLSFRLSTLTGDTEECIAIYSYAYHGLCLCRGPFHYSISFFNAYVCVAIEDQTLYQLARARDFLEVIFDGT